MVARPFPACRACLRHRPSIRDGTIKKFLVQPVDMLGFLLIGRVAHKLVYYLVATLPFALVFYLCRGYFTPAGRRRQNCWRFSPSLVMSFLLGLFSRRGDRPDRILVSRSQFAAVRLYAAQLFPLGPDVSAGHARQIPDRRLDHGWTIWFALSPLQYLAYFPAAIFLGKIHGAQLLWGLAGELAWLVALMAICRIAFNRGVRRYSALRRITYTCR